MQSLLEAFGLTKKKRGPQLLKDGPEELWALPPKEKTMYKPPLTNKQKAEAVIQLLEGKEGLAPTPIEKAAQFAEKTKPVTETALLPLWKLLEATRGAVGAEEPKTTLINTLISSAYKGIAEPEKVPPISVSAMKAYPKLPWQAAGVLGTLAELGVLWTGGKALEYATQPKTVAETGLRGDAELAKAGFTQDEISAVTQKDSWGAYNKKHGLDALKKLRVKFGRYLDISHGLKPRPVTEYYAGLPVPKDIIKKFNLTPTQVKNLQKGITAGIPAGAIKELTKLTPEVPTKIETYELEPKVIKPIVEQYAKTGITTGQFEKLLRKQIGKKDWQKMSNKEKLAEVREYILKDIEMAWKDIETHPMGPLDYVIDRTLDPLDPLNEFYGELLRREGATVIAGKSVKLPDSLKKLPPEITGKERYAITEKGERALEVAKLKVGQKITWDDKEWTIKKITPKATKTQAEGIRLRDQTGFEYVVPFEEIAGKKPPKELFPEDEDILSEYAEKSGEEELASEYDKFVEEEKKLFDVELKKLEQDPSVNLFKAIQSLGGVKSYKGGYFAEELRDIPLFLRNNQTGQHVDTLIQELRNLGWHFETSNELLEAITIQARSGYDRYGKIGRRPRNVAKAIKYTSKIRKARKPKRPKVSITPTGKELPYTTEALATPEQKILAHILMRKKGLTPRQFEYLKTVMVGKKTMAGPEVSRKQYVFEEGKPKEAIEYKGKPPMTKDEATRLIQTLRGIRTEKGKETVLPKTTALMVSHKISPTKFKTIEKYIKQINLPFDDIETLARLRDFDPDMLTEQQGNELLVELAHASKLPEGERIRYFVEKHSFKDEDLAEEFKNIEAYEGKIRKGIFDGGRRNIGAGKDYHSPFYQSLRMSNIQALKDVRLMMGDLEVKSGLPFHKHYIEISEAQSLKEAELKEVTQILTRNLDKSMRRIESAKLQKELSEYFDAIYNRRPAPELTEGEQAIADDIKEVMNKYKPFIKKYRFMQWVRSYRAGENAGEGFTDIPNVDYKTLKEGYDVLELQGEKALDEWLTKQTFGVIDVGYIPRAILGGKAKLIPYRIEAFTRRALKPRTTDIDLSNVPLIPRVERYLNAVLNLKYLEEPIKRLDDTLNIVSMVNHIPKETITRLSTWIDRVKGYSGLPSIPGKILTKIARQFFRVIVVRPYLWLRNLFQRIVTVPHKTPIMRIDTKPISADDQDYFDTHVSQMEEMEKSYLLFLRGQYTEIPILRQYSELSERVGRVYPMTDEMNRISVFKKSLHYYNRVIGDFVNNKTALKDLKNRTPYNLMRSYEQRHFLELLDRDPIEAGRWAAKWQSDNSQWLYKISERSVAEMDEAVRPLFNLFVWTKGLLQNLGANLYKATRGRTWDEKRSGIVALIGIIIAADLTQRVLQKVTAARKRGRYDYNILNTMFWSLGGATLGMLNEGQGALSELVFAYQNGDEAQKKRALSNALRMTDRIAMFQLPFLEPALNIIEAMTDTQYISPLYNALMKNPKHIERSEIEKFAHSIFGRVTQAKEARRRKRRRIKRKRRPRLLR